MKDFNAILFENNFGSMKGNEIKINKKLESFRFKSVNFLEIEKVKDTLIIYKVVLAILTFFLIFLLIQNESDTYFYVLMFFILIQLGMFVANNYRISHRLKIVSTEPSICLIPLHKNELDDAKKFISEFNRYKSRFSEFE